MNDTNTSGNGKPKGGHRKSLRSRSIRDSSMGNSENNDFSQPAGSCRDHSGCSMIMLWIEKLLETLQSSHAIPQMQF